MRVFRIIGWMACVWMDIAICNVASAQCVVRVDKNCASFQFPNACAEECTEHGAPCGVWAYGDVTRSYWAAEITYENESDTITVLDPRNCGVINKCKCWVIPGQNPLCLRTDDFSADLLVLEVDVAGTCLVP